MEDAPFVRRGGHGHVIFDVVLFVFVFAILAVVAAQLFVTVSRTRGRSHFGEPCDTEV